MNKLRRILLISDALYMLSGALLGPIYALYVREIGGDLLDASLTFALFMLTAGIVVFLLGLWEDKQKHKAYFVVAGYGIGVLGYLGFLFVSSPLMLFVVQIILGLSAALKDPAYDALFSSSGSKHLVLAWGEWEAIDYLTAAAGAIVGGFLAQFFGFKILLWGMFILSIFSFIASMLLLRIRIKQV